MPIEAFESWFQTVLADPPEGVRRILRRRSGRQSPREQLRGAMQQLARAPRFSGALAPRSVRPEWRDRCADGRADRAWGDLPPRAPGLRIILTRNLAEIARFVEENTRLEAVRGRDYDGLEAELRDLPGEELEAGRAPSGRLSERCRVTKCWPAATKPRRISMHSSRQATPISRPCSTKRCRRRSATTNS